MTLAQHSLFDQSRQILLTGLQLGPGLADNDTTLKDIARRIFRRGKLALGAVAGNFFTVATAPVSSAQTTGPEILALSPWPAFVVAFGVALILIWLWRRRALAAGRMSLYGSWHAAIPRYRRSLPRLTAELERARRYQRVLTVTVLVVDFDRHQPAKRHVIAMPGNAEIASQFFFSLVSSLLRDNVRGSDLVTYDVTNDYYVLLFPEATAAATEQTLRRLQQLVLQRSKVSLRYGLAEYPKDGLLIPDLVSRAFAQSQRMANEAPAEVSANGLQRPSKDFAAQMEN
jgi:GGDEF domain-containing protein